MIGQLLIQCPQCERLGRKEILGEIKDGFFMVMRFHNAYTKIRGEFEVICNSCDEPVYFKTLDLPAGRQGRRDYGTVSDYWSLGVYRSGTMQDTNQAGTPGTAFA